MIAAETGNGVHDRITALRLIVIRSRQHDGTTIGDVAMVKRTEQVLWKLNFLNGARIGPGFGFDHLIQHQREHARRVAGRNRSCASRYTSCPRRWHDSESRDFDRELPARGSGPAGSEKACRENRRPNRRRGWFDREQESFTSIAEERLGFKPIGSEARLGRGFVLVVEFLEEHVQPSGDGLLVALRIDRNLERRRIIGPCGCKLRDLR